MPEKDLLYTCFEETLDAEIHIEEEDEFIVRVVEKFWPHLSAQGYIQEGFQHEIKTDLEDEVQSMLQKKLYGFFSLKHFRMTQRKPGTLV